MDDSRASHTPDAASSTEEGAVMGLLEELESLVVLTGDKRRVGAYARAADGIRDLEALCASDVKLPDPPKTVTVNGFAWTQAKGDGWVHTGVDLRRQSLPGVGAGVIAPYLDRIWELENGGES